MEVVTKNMECRFARDATLAARRAVVASDTTSISAWLRESASPHRYDNPPLAAPYLRPSELIIDTLAGRVALIDYG
jgi:hypothetical protein